MKAIRFKRCLGAVAAVGLLSSCGVSDSLSRGDAKAWLEENSLLEGLPIPINENTFDCLFDRGLVATNSAGASFFATPAGTPFINKIEYSIFSKSGKMHMNGPVTLRDVYVSGVSSPMDEGNAPRKVEFVAKYDFSIMPAMVPTENPQAAHDCFKQSASAPFVADFVKYDDGWRGKLTSLPPYSS